MSVVLLYCGGTHVTRTWSMVTPDTSLFGRRTRAPAPAAGESRPRMRAPARPAGSAVRTSDVSSRARPAPAVLARDPVRAGVPRTG